MLAAFVGDLMGKIRRVEEWRIANDLDGKRKSQFLGFDAEEKAPFLDLFFNVFARIVFFSYTEFRRRNILKMGLVRCMEAFQ